MLLFALLNASICFGVYPVVSRPANQTTVVAVPEVWAAGAAVAAGAAAGAAGFAASAGLLSAGFVSAGFVSAGLAGAAGVDAPPPLHAASTPTPAVITRPVNRLRRLSRARCHLRSSLIVLTPSERGARRPLSRQLPSRPSRERGAENREA